MISTGHASEILFKVHWFDGLPLAGTSLAALDASPIADLVTPDRIALGAISIILSILYLLKVDFGTVPVHVPCIQTQVRV